MHGPCKWIDTFDSIGNLPPTSITREGNWEDGKLQGKVRIISTNGETWEEIWNDGNLKDVSLISVQPYPMPIDLNRVDVSGEIVAHSQLISPSWVFEPNLLGDTLISTSNSIASTPNPADNFEQSLNFEQTTSDEGNEVYYINKKFCNGAAYIGLCKSNEPIMGIMCYPNGDTYGGEFKNKMPFGQGKMNYSDGEIYEGNWRCGKPWGHGKMKYSNGDTYEGDWVNGNQHGEGTMVYLSGDIFEGVWDEGQFYRGTFTFANRSYKTNPFPSFI